MLTDMNNSPVDSCQPQISKIISCFNEMPKGKVSRDIEGYQLESAFQIILIPYQEVEIIGL